MDRQEGQEGKFRAEVKGWAGMILLLLFGTTMLMQAYVVPAGSMETTIMTGDHLFVGKLCYSPPGPISKHLLPYREVQRGDIAVFVYWSYDAPSERLASGNLNPEHLLDIALNFFSKTRWDRMFRLIRAHPIR
jgi:signal peptidase I